MISSRFEETFLHMTSINLDYFTARRSCTDLIIFHIFYGARVGIHLTVTRCTWNENFKKRHQKRRIPYFEDSKNEIHSYRPPHHLAHEFRLRMTSRVDSFAERWSAPSYRSMHGTSIVDFADVHYSAGDGCKIGVLAYFEQLSGIISRSFTLRRLSSIAFWEENLIIHHQEGYGLAQKTAVIRFGIRKGRMTFSQVESTSKSTSFGVHASVQPSCEPLKADSLITGYGTNVKRILRMGLLVSVQKMATVGVTVMH